MIKIAQDLFDLHGPEFIAGRAALLLGDLSIKEELTRLGREICAAIPIDNEWVLARNVNRLCIEGVENSEETFRNMSAAEIAGLEVEEIRPKLRDAIELLEEYSFFKL